MATISTLINFDFANGEIPVGPLVEDAAGNVFGTAVGATANGAPVEQVFEIARLGVGYANAPTILATFNDNSFLTSGLAIDAAGDVFAATNAANGASTDLYTFEKAANNYAPQHLGNVAGKLSGNLVVDGAGNLIGATRGSLFELSPNGLTTTLADFGSFPSPYGGADYFVVAGPSMAQDAAGNLFLSVAVASAGINSSKSSALLEVAKTSAGYASAAVYAGGLGGPLVDGRKPPVIVYAFGALYATSVGPVRKFAEDGSGQLAAQVKLPLPVIAPSALAAAVAADGSVYALAPNGVFVDQPVGAGYTSHMLGVFSSANGATPVSLILGPPGVLLGATSSGGLHGEGVFYRVDINPPVLTFARPSASGAGQLTLSGTIDIADAQLTIAIYGNGVRLATATPDASGAWTATLAASSGENDFSVVAVNSVGGSGSASATVFFNTNNQWATTSVTASPFYLVNAQVNFTEGGATAYLTGRGDAVSLYNAQAAADSVFGDNGIVILNSSQAFITGGGESIYFSGRADSEASLVSTHGLWDVAYGDGAILALTQAQVSAVGEDDVVTFYGSSGNAVSFYGAAGWEQARGDYGAITLNATKAAILGKGERVYFTAGSEASLYDTGGVADSVYGSRGVIELTSAQANVFGGYNTFYLAGQDDALDLYGTAGHWDTLLASDGVVTLHGAQLSLVGGGERITFAQGAGNAVSLYATNFNWDSVTGSGGTVILSGAQATIVGGGNTISFAAGVGNAVSLYNTFASADRVFGSSGAVNLIYAQAEIHGDGDQIAMSGVSAVTLFGAGERVSFGDAIGRQTLSGFALSDTLAFSTQDFADFAALSKHIAQSGADTLIRYDAANSVLLTGVQAKTLTAANFSFV